MTLGEALAATTAKLAAAGVPTPAVDARWLLGHVTGWSPAGIRSAQGEPLPADAAEMLDALVARRVAREPLQLLLGSVGFRHLELLVEPGVFIPRPETEILAGAAIDRVSPAGTVVEPCTGTGAVACAIAAESDAAVVLATDISAAAVGLARRNAARTGGAVEVLQGDLLDPVPADLRGRLDVLVCNPPYLAAGEVAGLEPEVAAWDPPEALVAGPTGHEVTDRLIAAALIWLCPGGWLLLETDAGRAAATAARARDAGLTGTAVLPDLTGADRVVVARHP